MPSSATLHQLRRQLAALEPSRHAPLSADRQPTAHAQGLPVAVQYAAVHDLFAASPRHGVAAHGFALGLALTLRPDNVVWIVQSSGRSELGELYGPGLAAWGLDPAHLILVRVGDAASLLAAGEDALRASGVGAVIMSGWGEAKAHSLTASRRLSLAAQQGAGLGLIVRACAATAPSAAQTRWAIASAPSPPLAANAPGRPAFRAQLLRSRCGAPPGAWTLEWNRESRAFIQPTASGDMVPLPADRPAAQGAVRRTRAA